MIARFSLFVVGAWLLIAPVDLAGAQGLPDSERAKALDRCHVVLQRTGTKLAVKKLKSLGICTHGILKCVETKPEVTRCRDQARERCVEQLRAGAAAEAALIDAVARKCGSDLALADLLSPLGLDVESLRNECEQRFGVALTDLTAVGTCLARAHACELERLAASVLPRAAGLLATAGVDASGLGCLTDHGGGGDRVPDARGVGRTVERCARAAQNAALKLVEANLKAVDRCLATIFTCVQVKNDPAAAPACLDKAEKRCAVEIANLAAAALRPAPALTKTCGTLDPGVLRAPEGLRLGALDAECTAAGAGPPVTVEAYADCLTRRHRCGVAVLARLTSPRADRLLTGLGTSLGGLLCPALAPTPTATPVVPTPTATPTIVAPTATIATPTPTPGCADDHGPSAFPGTPVDVSGDCPGGVCTDDGYDLTILGTIDVPGDTDFYVLDVVDLVGHSFALQAKLSDIPDDTNYDLFLYRFVGGQYVLLESSTHNGTGSESVEHSVGDNRQAGRYGVEVRGVSGASCGQYRLEIEDPN